MVLGPRYIMRSEDVEGELAGPAHPISDQSLDCGCGQMHFPKLVKYATRNTYVGLICWIGFIQGAAQMYFELTVSTIARRYNFSPNLIVWICLITDGFAPTILALPISYWGDRIHRAAWTGALTLIQCFSFIFVIIPHFTHSSSRVIEETINVTHLSYYAEDQPELCTTTGLARLSFEEEKETCYFTIAIIIIFQILNCMANIAYFALGISYLDDNTRKKHVAVPLSFILAFKLIGILFGYLLAWGCLQFDAEDLTSKIVTYREQIGAWWLGWPILAVLLVLPALAISWLPRRLPSEVVEQAAASILDLAGRTSPISESTISEEAKKFGDITCFASFVRLLTNKILVCNILASVFCITALVNFANNVDIFLESRFYVPRPLGVLLGFNDPWISRIVTTLLKPIIIGLFVIISGIIIVKLRPRAKWLIIYNIIIGVIAACIIFSLSFYNCEKPSIVGFDAKGSSLLDYCNKNCRCLKEANFVPVCDVKNLKVFYTPCHAGCTGIDDTSEIKKYTGCSCIEDTSAGTCDLATCQIGWIVFQISTTVTYSLMASVIVSCFLIGLRSIFVQDKALAIGLWITLCSFFTYIPGKIIYWKISDLTCIHRGIAYFSCHLHDPEYLGSYLAYITSLLLLIGVSFQLLTYYFSRNLKLFRESHVDSRDVVLSSGQSIPLVDQTQHQPTNFESTSPTDINTTNAEITAINEEAHQSAVNTDATTAEPSTREYPQKKVNGPLKYGPLGPGSPRKTHGSPVKPPNSPISSSDDTDDDQAVNKRAPLSLSTISYRRLKMDSDDMSDSSAGSLQRIDTSLQSPPSTAENKSADNSSYSGNFNEVGIPIVDYPLTSMNSRSIGSFFLPSSRQMDTTPKHQGKNNNSNKDDKVTDGGLSRTSTPDNASSGFQSSAASDVQRTGSKPTINTARNISKSTSNLETTKPKIYGYTTAI